MSVPALGWPPLVQPEEFCGDKFIEIDEESDCHKQKEDVPEEKTAAKSFPSKELSEILCDVGVAKDKVLEADPNVGKRG